MNETTEASDAVSDFIEKVYGTARTYTATGVEEREALGRAFIDEVLALPPKPGATRPWFDELKKRQEESE